MMHNNRSSQEHISLKVILLEIHKHKWTHLQQIELYTTFSVDNLVLSFAHLTRLEHGLLHLGLVVMDTTQEGKIGHLAKKVSRHKVTDQIQC